GIEIAVVLIQVDDFDYLVHSHGTAVAKQLLRKLAKYITEAIDTDDVVTRLGTSCFAVIPVSLGTATVKKTAA
ncbi:MAG: diguanylate cyclase, partial [Burkholderiales bacterium]|nr:diguanylate cyclase [Burkholderiales bacterium]